MLKQLNEVRNLKDPLKQFVSTWSFGEIDGVGLDFEDLELRCQSYGFPTLTGDTTDVTWGGFARKYAGKQTRQGEWTVNFIEVWDVAILDGFRSWANKYHQYKAGKISLLADYSTYADIKLLNPSVYDLRGTKDVSAQEHGGKLEAYNIRLYDVFPMSVNASQIDASSSDPITLEVTFNYNYFLLGSEIEDAQSSDTSSGN